MKKSIKFEDKTESLEHRNKELESTIQILQDRINTLAPNEAGTSIPSLNIPPVTKSELSQNEQLIKGIHDRVSAFVLLKVEKQIERLIDIDNSLCENDMCYS